MTVNAYDHHTNAARKSIRTGLQVIVAYVPMLLLLLAGVVNPAAAASIGLALTPFVSFAQNLLEDKGIVGTWLRRPTPADG